ncbi:IS6 family transposase [Candidatus Tisiphia endosymbiont of Neophilaenus lineatus]|uniref:IS6 family transposase n=1 Tax=Candidatus Tisiphia endosymbiont of Neophilaenus lineatus TaxID=3139336 RepID=UPI0035CB50D7
MCIIQSPKRHRFPVIIISHAVWLYHRFNNSYRDVQEQMAYRGIILSHETVRFWCNKFAVYFQDVIRKRERKPTDKWHLDEMNIKIQVEVFILWRAVDSEGHELEVLLQKRRNKKSAIRFLSKLLGHYPAPRVIVTDKLRSYIKPIKLMCPKTEHRTHKRLNNRVENAHQPTRRNEKILIKFKHPNSAHCKLSLMGKVRNIFAVNVGRYSKTAIEQRIAFASAKSILDEATQRLLAA